MARKILTSNTSSHSGNMHYYHLPMGLVMLTIRRTASGDLFVDDPTISYLPDPDARYHFSYKPSPFTDDDITIEFNEQGFLSHVHTLVDDQLDDVITKTFELGTSIVEGVTGFGGMKRRNISEEKIIFSGTIDPFDDSHIENVNKALESADEEAVFSVDLFRKKNSESGGNVPKDGYGIYSRPMDLFNLTLTEGEAQIFKTVKLPNPNKTHFIEIPSPGMVKTEFQIKFDALGYPTFINIKKPSSALALVQLPLTIIRAIIELPTKLIQLRVNLDSNNTAAAQNELNLKKIQKQLTDYNNEQAGIGEAGQEIPNSQSQLAVTRNIPQNDAGGASDEKVSALEEELKLLKRDFNDTRKRFNDTKAYVDTWKRQQQNDGND